MALQAWLHLALLPKIGPARFRRLLEAFGSPEAVLRASARDLALASGADVDSAEQMVSARERIDPEAELEFARKAGAQVFTWEDPRYPVALKAIPDPPPVLYVLGTLTRADTLAVAVVGTRRASPYGLLMAERLAAEMAGHGITVVSGLARGVDTAAHRAALKEGGRTIAVLGNGLSVFFPAENRRLQEQIPGSGAVVSEFPMRGGATRENFPRRNRVISGLSLGVVVVEADVQSGAMITAGQALEQGREVFAVPGSLLSKGSRGPHRLIQQGAKLIQGVEDLVEEIKALSALFPAKREKRPGGSTTEGRLAPEQERVYRSLGAEPAHIDLIQRDAGLPIQEVAQILTELEVLGLVRQFPGKRYLRPVPA